MLLPILGIWNADACYVAYDSPENEWNFSESAFHLSDIILTVGLI